MQPDTHDRGIRSKVGSFVLYAGLVLVAISILWAPSMIRGFKEAGGGPPFAGVARWQESPLLLTFAFSCPLAFSIMMAGAALRVSRASVRLSVAVPLLLWLIVLFFSVVLWSPTITRLFAVGGTVMAVAICVTIYFSVKRIRPENPWPGLLQGTGYLLFGMLTWFLCGLATPFPGGILYPELKRDYAVLTDIVTKIHLTVLFGWSTTALGFLLDRRAVVERSDDSVSSPASGPLVGSAQAARSASTSR
jgi:hypothetical protein